MIKGIDSITILTLILGIIGTVTGIGSLILEFYRELLNNYHLKLKLMKNMRGVNAAPRLKPDTDYAIFTIINTGRSPVKINTVYLRMLTSEKIKNFVLTDSFTPYIDRVLTRENPATDYTLEQEGTHIERLLYVGVIDAYGKEHKLFILNPLFRFFWKLYMRIKYKIS